jgi:hypothetical protein
MHMNILTALLKGIKDRQLDNFFQLEENISKQTKVQILDIIKDNDKGNDPMDKLRLFIIWFLSTEQELSRADMDQFDEALIAAGADTTSLKYVKQARELTRMNMMSSVPNQQGQQSASTDLFKGFSAMSSRLTSGLKEAGIGANFENLSTCTPLPIIWNQPLTDLVSGVKNLMPQNKDLTLTKSKLALKILVAFLTLL